MAAYMIADIEITDMDTYDKYRAEVPATIAAHGGKFLVRGVEGETTEGDWIPKRLVILEFESMEKAKGWYNSPEYRPLKELRIKASKCKVVFTEGI